MFTDLRPRTQLVIRRRAAFVRRCGRRCCHIDRSDQKHFLDVLPVNKRPKEKFQRTREIPRHTTAEQNAVVVRLSDRLMFHIHSKAWGRSDKSRRCSRLDLNRNYNRELCPSEEWRKRSTLISKIWMKSAVSSASCVWCRSTDHWARMMELTDESRLSCTMIVGSFNPVNEKYELFNWFKVNFFFAGLSLETFVFIMLWLWREKRIQLIDADHRFFVFAFRLTDDQMLFTDVHWHALSKNGIRAESLCDLLAVFVDERAFEMFECVLLRMNNAVE